jgi:hypothetical protein
MASFAQLGRVQESSFFLESEKQALRETLEKLIARGEAPPQALAALQRGPEVRTKATELFKFNPNLPEAPLSQTMRPWSMGSRIELGRTKWNLEGVSIFSVEDGKRLAQTPTKASTAAEARLAARLARAAADSPLVAGYRLLPLLTPNRAFMWGTILAVWSTATITLVGAKRLGITGFENMGERMREALRPYVESAEQAMAPYKVDLAALEGSAKTSPAAAFGQRIRSQFSKE